MAKNVNASENINVVCRVRPQNEDEKSNGGVVCVRTPYDRKTVEMKNEYESHTFSFDRVFPEDASQIDLYDEVAGPIIEAVTHGINAAIIAYGQTGSGKTHTMYGQKDVESQGLVPRSLRTLFNYVNNPYPNEEFYCVCSFVQIYKEQLLDLLTDEPKHCLIREDKNRGLWITDAAAIPIQKAEEAQKLMEKGEKNRVVATTRQNASSSRSHSVFLVSVSRRIITERTESVAQLYLVDLAGSESVDKTGSEGVVLEEAKHINQSLFALRNVINALVTNKQHVPYRDSKLTRMLQNSFGGNAKTTLVVCISPSTYNYRETLSSLRFGDSTRQITNKPVVNVHRSAEELLRMINQTQNEISEARDQIRALERILSNNNVECSPPQTPSLIMGRPGEGALAMVPEELPSAFRCPLTGKLMITPIIAMDGYTYDKQSFLAYINEFGHTPALRGDPGLEDTTYIANIVLQDQITAYNKARQNR